jgi:septum formation protein
MRDSESNAGTYPLWRASRPLLLASTSATRRTMLEAAGIPVEAMPPGIDERRVEAGEGANPEILAARLARAKALAVSERHPGRLVVGADQTLSCGGDLFHKPKDLAAARRQLRLLAGRTHRLHSAAALARGGRIVGAVRASAKMTMRPLTGAFISRYVAALGADVTCSVGGYRLEGLGVTLFEKVEGDHFTILGLPLLGLLRLLRREGSLAG